MKIQLIKILFLFVFIIVGTGCKKKIEQAKADAVVDAMVANKWTVLQYIDGSNDVSAEFTGYEFQFNRDNTVTGTNNLVYKTGTWSGDAAAQTIFANFTNTTTPLTRLNGTWSIYYYDSNGPKFKQVVNGVEMRLVLRKK